MLNEQQLQLVYLLGGLLFFLFAAIFSFSFFYSKFIRSEIQNEKQDANQRGGARAGRGGLRRRKEDMLQRMQAEKNKNEKKEEERREREEEEEEEEERNEEEEENGILFENTKARRRKAAKEAKKEDKKAQKEAERVRREGRQRENEEKLSYYKKKQKEKEEERLIREKKEKEMEEAKKKEEEEEYQKWKANFVLLKSGETEIADEANALSKFIQFIKKRKFLHLDQIAAHFHLTVHAVIDRITELEKDGALLGVFDDRGKYLCITEEEIEELIKCIEQAGRINKTNALVEACNRIIRLAPTQTDKEMIEEEERSAMNEVLASIEESQAPQEN